MKDQLVVDSVLATGRPGRRREPQVGRDSRSGKSRVWFDELGGSILELDRGMRRPDIGVSQIGSLRAGKSTSASSGSRLPCLDKGSSYPAKR